MASSAQTVTGIQVFDYLLNAGGTVATQTALKGVTVRATLQYPQASFSSPVVYLAPIVVTATTDQNGYWTMYLPANKGTTPINPSGTTYLIDTGGILSPYEISVSDQSVPVGGWQSSAIVVNTPAAIGVSGYTLPTGVTAAAGFTVTGTSSLNNSQSTQFGVGLTTGQVAIGTAPDGVGQYRKFYVLQNNSDTSAAALDAIEVRTDMQHATTNSVSAQGVYGTIWVSGAGPFSGDSGSAVAAAIQGNAYTRPGAGAVNGWMMGLRGRVWHESSNVLNTRIAVLAVGQGISATGGVTNDYGFRATSPITNGQGSPGTIANYFGMAIDDQGADGTAPPITNAVGLYVGSQTLAGITNPVSIKVQGPESGYVGGPLTVGDRRLPNTGVTLEVNPSSAPATALQRWAVNNAVYGILTPNLLQLQSGSGNAQLEASAPTGNFAFLRLLSNASYFDFAVRDTDASGALQINPAGGTTNQIRIGQNGSLTLTGTGGIVASGNNLSIDQVTITDAKNIVLATATGTKIGTATNQKVAFFNSTPIIQPSAVGSATGYAAGTTAATFHSDDTYTGNVGSTAYTINGVVAALKNLGLIAA